MHGHPRRSQEAFQRLRDELLCSEALSARGKSHPGCERVVERTPVSLKRALSPDKAAYSLLDLRSNPSLSPAEHFHHGLLWLPRPPRNLPSPARVTIAPFVVRPRKSSVLVLPLLAVTPFPVGLSHGTTYGSILRYLTSVCGGDHGEDSHGSCMSEPAMPDADGGLRNGDAPQRHRRTEDGA